MAQGIIRFQDSSEADFLIPNQNGEIIIPRFFNYCNDLCWARGTDAEGFFIPFLMTKQGVGDWLIEETVRPAGLESIVQADVYPTGMSGKGTKRIAVMQSFEGSGEWYGLLFEESLTPTLLELAGHDHVAPWAISGNGNFIVGGAANGTDTPQTAWIRTNAGGMQTLAAYLLGQGLDMSAYDLLIATGISGNGKHIQAYAQPSGGGTERLLYITVP